MFLFNKKKNIDAIAKKGNSVFDKGDYLKAIEIWKEGLDNIKQPHNGKGEAVWFQTSIADAYFMLKEYEKAYDFLMDAKSNISGVGVANPFVMLRFGQCCYELNKKEEAQEYLFRAYLLAGKEIFEEDDAKYFKCVEDIINAQ